jgi:hypothetical protein
MTTKVNCKMKFALPQAVISGLDPESIFPLGVVVEVTAKMFHTAIFPPSRRVDAGSGPA